MPRLLLAVLGALLLAYQPPVDAPVVDPFRPPAHPYGPGNRGLEYAPRPGSAVRAIGDGRVVFAGPVAGRLHVSVDHPDGLRSTYSLLRSITVRVGTTVTAGQELGRSGARFHLGVRVGDEYLDPAALFAVAGPRVRLVPLSDDAVGARLGARTGHWLA
jgi:murein DD-endopeptidase MepM/ murein hydrolase activator NlpD